MNSNSSSDIATAVQEMQKAVLNPEPSLPEERQDHDLPPKSYAEAAEEGLRADDDQKKEPTLGQQNGESARGEHNGESGPNEQGDFPALGKHDGRPPQERDTVLHPKSSLLHAQESSSLPSKSYTEAAEEGLRAHVDQKFEVFPVVRNRDSISREPSEAPVTGEQERHQVSREQNQDSALGKQDEGLPSEQGEVINVDGNAASTERHGHHLPLKPQYAEAAEKSLETNGDQSKEAVSGDQSDEPAPVEQDGEPAQRRQYTGAPREHQETDGAGDTVLDERTSHKRVASSQMNKGHKKSKGEGVTNYIYEKHEGKDGERLLSVKQPQGYENPQGQGHRESPEQHERGQSQLVSGRQAGDGWAQSSIRWAPLNVPLKRRLQTLVVLLHTLSIGGCLAIFFFLCAIPLLWPILIPYLIYVLVSRAGTSGELTYRSDRFRRAPVWSLFASYFPARLHRSEPLPPTRKYLFGYHPHGIISHGAFAAFATEALGFSQLFPGITNTLLTLESNFRVPLYRDYALRMGLGSVSRESCENLLSKGGLNGEGMGRAITIVIGGARESLEAKPRSLRLILKRRKGFVKLAIRQGADLVPVLAFGENDLYEQLEPEKNPRVHSLQLAAKKFLGFTVPLFHARGIFNYDVGLMPYRRPLNIVVGRPIMVEQKTDPEVDYVDQIHQAYVDELFHMWDEWKDTFAKNRTTELQIEG